VFAGQSDCREISALARISRARSSAALSQLRAEAGQSYVADFVYVFRAYELKHGSVEARDLLRLIPRDESQSRDLLELSSALCERGSLAEMTSLARITDEVPRRLADAVIVVPDFMLPFVEYSFLAVHDPHSDVAVQMARVCKRTGAAFNAAVARLAEDKRSWFGTHILNAASCRALTLPEAER
jgi:hypothetical protein